MLDLIAADKRLSFDPISRIKTKTAPRSSSTPQILRRTRLPSKQILTAFYTRPRRASRARFQPISLTLAYLD